MNPAMPTKLAVVEAIKGSNLYVNNKYWAYGLTILYSISAIDIVDTNFIMIHFIISPNIIEPYKIISTLSQLTTKLATITIVL